jgi:hypothetical protein
MKVTAAAVGRALRGVVIAGMVASPVAARAQEEVPEGLRAVFVQPADGASELRGHLLQLGPETMTLLVEGQRVALPMSSVMRVDSGRDSVGNGALIGAIMGGAWCALVCGQAIDSGPAVAIGVAINAGFWGGIGAGIDALIPGRTTIYRRPTTPPSARAGISYRLTF